MRRLAEQSEQEQKAHIEVARLLAEQKRNTGDRWDRVAGRIESLIQGRVRSRGHDIRW